MTSSFPATARTLSRAVREVLSCPGCYGDLSFEKEVVCSRCARRYPVEDGIVLFLDSAGAAGEQQDEHALRERIMGEQVSRSVEEILAVIARHHSASVMAARAGRFRATFDRRDWLLDIGGGSGWAWRKNGGAALLLLDFSIESLRVARRILGDRDDILPIWADVRHLPLRRGAIAGVWSVQVFQHFPADVFARALAELDRVLLDAVRVEIYNLNPAPALRLLYRLAGRRLHVRGRLGEMDLNRLSARQLREAWSAFRGGQSEVSTGYSELFFHPDFRLRPDYSARVDEWLAGVATPIAALFARQVHICLESRAGSHA